MKTYELLLSENRYAEAIALLEKEIEVEVAQKTHKKPNALDALVSLGICYYETQQMEKARTVLEKSLEIARSEVNQYSVSRVLHELSLVVSAQGENDKAIEMCKESVELQLELGEEPTLVLHTLSVLYQKVARWDEAMEILAMVRESCEARNDLEGLGRCLNEIGLTYLQKGDLATAVRYLVDSIELKHQIGNERGIELSLKNLSACLQDNPFLALDPNVKQHLDRLQGILE